MNPILSIIIPSYNSEKYISKCLDSCVKQDLQPNEYEIIIVNDGSDDRTFEIAQNYASSHCNIKIVTTINQGVCMARNTGMKEAAGEFLWFIDSDDYIKPNCLHHLIETAKTNDLDLMWFKWKRIDENGNPLPPYKGERLSENTAVMSGDMFLRTVFDECGFVWAFFWKRSFLLNHDLFFNPEITYTEDLEFIMRAATQATKVKFVNESPYIYTPRIGGLAKSLNSNKYSSMIKTIITAAELSKLYPNQPFYKDITTALIITLIRKISYPQYKHERKILPQTLKDLGIKRLHYRHNGIRKYMANIYNISPRLCIAISRLLKK